MKLCMKKDEALKNGYTHEGYYLFIPIWVGEDSRGITMIREKCILFYPIFTFLSAIEMFFGGITFRAKKIEV